jgi:deoxycytidylate deaminase
MLNQLFMIAQDVVPVSRARIVAALVYKNKIVSVGVNEMKTHPMAAKFSKHPEAKYLHAEISAIRNCINRHGVEIIKKSTLYIARAKHIENAITDEFVWGLAKPCSGCEQAILEFGIKKVIYTTDEQNHIGIGYY